MTDPLEALRWIHGAPDCAASGDPPLQVEALDGDSFVLRISKCWSFEANFLFLLLGRERAVLFDTGGAPDDPLRQDRLPLREAVEAILAGHPWGGAPGYGLVVAHTHSHRDHVHEDRQFADRPGTVVVGHDLGSVTAFWGLPDWPEGEASLDLGGRRLSAIAIPGHEARHIAVFDERTGTLLSGDFLYPGLITVRDWPAFRASARRLAAFAAARPLRRVLGCHVEMSRRPGVLYPLGTTWQPEEHPLPLGPAHVRELHELCEALGDDPRDVVRGSFALAILPGARPGEAGRSG